MQIIIDPRARISYASYYIAGLYEVLGKRKVKFSMQPFKDLEQSIAVETFDQYFAFVVKDKNNLTKRVIVDYRDKSNINLNALVWSDVYAKVNFNQFDSEYDAIEMELQNKIIPIGTNFGIRIWNTYDTIKFLFLNYFKSWRYLPVNFRSFLSGYNWQLKREKIDFYQSAYSQSAFVFHASSFYVNQDNGDAVNNLRAMFIRSCKANKACVFKGGLLSQSNKPTNQQYSDVFTDQYYPADQYLQNIKKSAFVFNSPAAWACHGWKLREYLAMGKAIISTQFVNQMPEDFVHGENIFFVNNENEMRDAVNLLLSDNKLRTKLEDGAKEYYNKWLKPDVCIKRIIDNL